MTDSPTPPRIDGIEFLDPIGGGGFSTVWRAHQVREARDVAVKVLNGAGFDTDRLAAFEAECRTMAQVSGHPRIAKIFAANVTGDGRPYLILQYYPRGHYGRRVASAPLSQDEALRVGVQIACAVQTAHSAGIIHCDIKPENILIDAYGPVLTDFGISTYQSNADLTAEDALTIPYAAPELLLGRAPASVATDVYALAGTIWTLLCGQPPHGGLNGTTPLELMRKMVSSPVPAMVRADVSQSLSSLLRQALDRDPDYRPPTARALAHSLRAVEVQLGYTPTALDLDEDDLPPTGSAPWTDDVPIESADRTRAHTVLTPQPRRAGAPRVIRNLSAVHAPQDTAASRPLPLPEAYSATEPPPVAAGGSVSPSEPVTSAPGPRRAVAVSIGLLIVVVAVVFGVILDSKRTPAPTATTRTVDTDEPTAVPVITDVTATRRAPDLVEISWTLPDRQTGEVVNVRRVDPTGPVVPSVPAGPGPGSLRVEAPPHACFAVWVVARDRVPSDPPERACA